MALHHRYPASAGPLAAAGCPRGLAGLVRVSGCGGQIRPRARSVAAPLDRLAADQLLERGFAALSPRQRSLLWLALVEGLDHGGIAEALGLRKASVKVLLSRARERFAAVLDIPGQPR
ncbi:MAG: sigma-70 region 4 domain-containing protein [Holophagaceae bacterium]|nr:sigma-70 region 4 domain-containing protein [Holophagaceae bacterium]